MGGMDAVVRQLSSDNATLKAAAFWCLGTVAANNPPAQASCLFSFQCICLPFFLPELITCARVYLCFQQAVAVPMAVGATPL